MRRLLDFLYRQREIVVFLVLEVLSAWLLINYNRRYNATFFNSSNQVAGEISQSSEDISNYFRLETINKQLMVENELLQKQLINYQEKPESFLDTVQRFQVIGSRVVSNTFRRSTNFLTLASGSADSVAVGMGVISAMGVVGQVKSVSERFATVYSILHPNLLISSKIKRTQTSATVQWDQRDYQHAELKYIPRHIELKVGDTVVTSGFNAVFPEGIAVGTVDEFDLEEEMTFYKARIRLATDFTSLNYVFVIKDLLKQERDSIEML